MRRPSLHVRCLSPPAESHAKLVCAPLAREVATNMPGWASLRRVGTSPQTSLVGEINDAVAQYFVTMSLRNVCVVFYPEQRTQYRSQFVSREGVTAVLHGFSEYDLGYQRLTTVRPEQARDRQQLARCTTKQLAIAVPMSSNNLYHQAFHAVPAWEALRAHASHNATLLPLVFPSAAFGRGKPASPRRWYVQPRARKVGRVWLACPPNDGGGLSNCRISPSATPRQPLGSPSAARGLTRDGVVTTTGWRDPPGRVHIQAWEFTVRALSNATSSALAASTRELLGSPCTCFDRVEAHAPAFNPGASASATRLRAFRAATLRNNLVANNLVAPQVRATLLFVSRVGSRRVTVNEAALMSRLRADTSSGVQRVVLEDLPFAAKR